MSGARVGSTSDRARRVELRLVPAAIGAWLAGGILIGLDPTPALGIIAGVLWAAATATALLALRTRGWALLSLALTAAALVGSVVAVRAPERVPAVFADATHRGTVELLVTATGQVHEGRVTATAWLREHPDAGETSLLVFLPEGEGAAAVPQIGETWALAAQLRPTDPADDVTMLAFAREPGVRLAEAPPGLAAATALRSGLRDISADLPGRGAQLLPGLAVGDTSRVDEALDTDMKTSSLSHLTAVSGANCAIVVGAVFALCALLGFPRGARVAVSLAALAGFVVLVTPEPSVLRAAVMAGAVLLGLASGRPARGVPVLCLAVVTLLVVDPWLARSYGFALSVLATAGLLLIAGPLARVFERWMPAPLALVIAVPLAAQLACQPVLVLLSPSLPLWGVPANLLAGPAAPIATIVGLVACLVTPVAPPLAAALAAIAWLPASWIAATATLFATLPGARMPWPGGALGLAAVAVLTVLAIAAFLGPPAARWRRAAAVLALAGTVGAGGAVGATAVATLLERPADWQYAMCDVGQGDATLVRSQGVVALVDTGPDPALLTACLDQLGIGTIDLLVLTHYDADHVGGVEAVLGRVTTVLAGEALEPEQHRILDALRAEGATLVTASDGLAGTLGQLHWRTLWPPPRGVEPGNASSIVLRIDPDATCRGCRSALMLGDLGEEEQLRLAARHPTLPVDVLKVAHHGSGDTSATLIAAARAHIALIGVGADNDYGHPSQRALDALAASGSAVFRTDTDGLILVGTSGVWTSRRPSDVVEAR